MNPNKDLNEEKLSEQLQRLLTSIEASGRAVLPKSNDVLLKSIVDAAARIFGAAAASILLVNPSCDLPKEVDATSKNKQSDFDFKTFGSDGMDRFWQ